MTHSSSPEAPKPTAKPLASAELTHPLLAKAQRLAQRFQQLDRARLEAEAETGLTRARLTLALHHALAARTRAEARLRQQLIALHRRAARRAPRRYNRIAKAVDRLLFRLGSLGRSAVIVRSGLWRRAPDASASQSLRDIGAYLAAGSTPGVQPPALVDQDFYLATQPDIAASGSPPLLHYILSGGREGRAPHPLFDPAYYARRYGSALAPTGLTPLEHFVRFGVAEGLNPHPLFDSDWYVSQIPELAESGGNPLVHYLDEGWRAGLSPHPVFAPDFYLAQVHWAEPEGPPLVHYVVRGWRAGLKPHPLFDPAWYLGQHPSLAALQTEPLAHFLNEGAARGLEPSGWFSCAAHLEARGGEMPAGVNPLVDYLTGGAWLAELSRPGFSPAAYLAAHSDLAQSGLTPLEHWARRSQG